MAMDDPLLLYHVSDLHFGYEDRAALDWFAAEVARERPRLVICTGDFTMRGSAREFALAEQWLAQLPVPLVMTPGNHDVPYYHHMLRRLIRPYQRYQALEAALATGHGDASVAVVPLKTIARAQWRLNWSKGRVSEADLDRALQGLAHLADRPLRLVAGHHPLIDAEPGDHGSTRGGLAALSALTRAGAKVVLSGHVHDPFDREISVDGQSIRLIGAGTLSRRLRASPPGFNRLEWTAAAGLTVTHRQLC